MSEPSLSLAKKDLEAEIGFYLGFGRGAQFAETAWTAAQQAQISSVRASGERQFYFPPPVPDLGIPAAYDWSWLKPVATLTLHQGQSTLALPDDWGGKEGTATLSLPTGMQWWQLQWTGPQTILAKQSQYPTTTGRPWLIAEEPLKGTTPQAGQRSQARVWPTPDQDYAVKVQYYVTPDALTDAFPYCLGGAQHAETVKASCIAAAELYLDNLRGPRWQYFLQCLATSVGMDRRNKPQTVGKNIDRSDCQDRTNQWRPHGLSPITVQGTLY